MTAHQSPDERPAMGELAESPTARPDRRYRRRWLLRLRRRLLLRRLLVIERELAAAAPVDVPEHVCKRAELLDRLAANADELFA